MHNLTDCKLLFHSPIGAIALVRGLYSEGDRPLLIRDLSCSGAESALLDCPYNELMQTSCGPFNDAGIVCQGMITVVLELSFN